MYEYIEESERGRRNDNDCYHIRYLIDEPTGEYSYRTYTAPVSSVGCEWTTNDRNWRWRSQMPALNSAPYGLYGTKDLDSFTVIGNPELEQAKEDGLISMWPRIKADLLSLNSLYELKDFKRLPAFLTRISTARAYWPQWVRAWSDLTHRTKARKGSLRPAVLREGFRLGSEGYLTNEFAIKPLLADISNLHKSLTSYKKQLRTLLENAKTRRTIYYSRPLTTFFPESDESTLVPNVNRYNGDRYHRKVERIQDPVFRCRMEYSYEMPKASIEELELRALLDSVGVNFNPQIIWNAIPWSFVLDWLIGVNRWLGNTKVNNIEPDVTIYRYSWSAKASRRLTLKTTPSEGSPTESTIVNRTSEEYYYYRSTQMPDWGAYVKVSGLNLKEFSYIGALIGARS